MTCSFHPFPKLPAELRIQIWDAACLSYDLYSLRGIGMHYIDLDPSADDTTILAYHKSTADAVDGDDHSACLVHALLTTCKESRYVVSRYWNHYRYGDMSVPPAMLPVREIGGVWHAPVCPAKDIFCIKSKTWNTPDNHMGIWQIKIPDFTSQQLWTTNIQNIAFEFDKSWNKDLPKRYLDLMSETSARGCLSRFLYNRYLNSSTTPKIWIIVKNGQWTIDPDHPLKPFHDCDTEYVSVSEYFSCRHCRRTHDFDGVFESVRSFTNSLDNLGVAGTFNLESHISRNIKFLAHRDMQIDLCTGRGPHEDEKEDDDDSDLGF
ncbi:uncharacterized protein FSUBG_2904 [Fusarium subglutinans]|uniref:2EXR domain-containing protein n=1 Tax=Gibberella subglutinans TaxID=42677 RepID=A0A8H5QAY8_GIBSU|nr:uncharacterized protein FSUBG_2904 [Fusarium subglutinans]KAF5610643.1 hypothetical protein FSUBG_2904 [Fusarium subglutinans]